MIISKEINSSKLLDVLLENGLVTPLRPDGTSVLQGNDLYVSEDADLIAIQSVIDAHNIIDVYKTNKIESLYALCNAAVLGIFESSALGTPHDYIFDYEAQMNLAGTKQAFDSALITNVEWNTRDAGVLVHNETQFNQLWLDGFTHKISTINKYRTLKSQVENASDETEIDSIVW